jgi:hypothetical protein
LSTALALVLDEHYYVNYPASFWGISNSSSCSASYADKPRCFKLEEVPGLPTNINETWNSNIPRYWTPVGVENQAMFEVLQAFHSDKKINFIPCYASFIVLYRKEKQILKEVITLLFSYSKFNVCKYLEFIYLICRSCVGWLYRRIFLFLKIHPDFTVSILLSTEDVMKFLKRYPYGTPKNPIKKH